MSELDYLETTHAFEALARKATEQECEWKPEPQPGEFYSYQMSSAERGELVNELVKKNVYVYLHAWKHSANFPALRDRSPDDIDKGFHARAVFADKGHDND